MYPEVELEVSLDERFVDIVNEGFDLAVRIGSLKDTSLIARRMASGPFVICANAGYLETHSIPHEPDDLVHHNVLAFTGNSRLHEWCYQDSAGQIGQVNLGGNFKTDTGDILCSAALKGVGIAILPVFYVSEHLKNQQLHAMLTDYITSPKRDIYAVFRPNRFQSTRQRLFVDHLISTCKQLPWES